MHEQPHQRLSRGDVIWALAALCQRHGIPFDAALFAQRHPPDAAGTYPICDLLAAADALGMRVEEHAGLQLSQLQSRLPALLVQPAPPAAQAATQASPQEGAQSPTASVAVVTAVTGERVCWLRPQDAQPCEASPSDLQAAASLPLYCFHAPPEPIRDEDGQKLTRDKPFGFSWFVPELLRYRSVWRDILAASLALQVVGLATPLFTQVIVDKVVVHQSRSTLIAAAVGLALAIAFSAVFSWVRQYLVLHTGTRVDVVLGSRVFAHLLKLPVAYFARRPTGTLVARLQGIESIREFLAGAAITLVLDLPFMVILLAVMFWYSWQLSLIALGLLLLLAGLSAAVTPLLRSRLERQFLLGARNQAFVTEYVSGMDTVKALQLEPQLERRYGASISEYVGAGFRTRQLGNSYQTAAHSLEQLQGLAILAVGALLVMQNQGFTIGMLIAFQMFSSRLSQPLLRLVGLYQEFQQANLSVRRLADMMNAPAEPYSLLPARSAAAAGEIAIRDLGFRYSAAHPWLYRNLSLSIPAGRTTLIVGPSGCGKSTLAKLLLNFYRPEEGTILLDGRDVRHFSANELRSRFGVVPQETVLFSGTVFENLQMANPLASMQQIVQACRMAEIHDVIEQLPQGYQTELGEHGVGLSGGQKQRIAIARALLKRPRVLVFDEATSSLDAQTAAQFARTVNQLRGKVTILFIAHQVPRGLHVDDTVILGAGAAPPAAAPGAAPSALRTGESA